MHYKSCKRALSPWLDIHHSYLDWALHSHFGHPFTDCPRFTSFFLGPPEEYWSSHLVQTKASQFILSRLTSFLLDFSTSSSFNLFQHQTYFLFTIGYLEFFQNISKFIATGPGTRDSLPVVFAYIFFGFQGSRMFFFLLQGHLIMG